MISMRINSFHVLIREVGVPWLIGMSLSVGLGTPFVFLMASAISFYKFFNFGFYGVQGIFGFQN